MREVVFSSRFNRDLKKAQRSASGKALLDLSSAIESLAADILLPERFQDHPLSGQFADCRECHIRPDLLLVYQKVPGRLYLTRLGSHSELFR